MEVIDFLNQHPSAKFTPEEFVGFLPKLPARLYSVASSLKACPDQVHFIWTSSVTKVMAVTKGICSSFIAERADDVPVPVFSSVAKHFHLPEDPDTSIIMVGPGTGVAPLLAYLQEREDDRRKGRIGFFSDHGLRSGILLRSRIRSVQERGDSHTARVDWSRDQTKKISVQHRMTGNAAEIWKWLDAEGAHFFVCGDARGMARELDATLRNIVRDPGGKNIEEANE